MTRKVLALVLTLTTLLTCCAFGTTALADVDVSKPMRISIFMQADDKTEAADAGNPVIAYWAQLFNLDIEWQKPPIGSETEQINMMLGTGDYTDVIDLGFNKENLETLWKDEVIYELSDYIDQYMPNYKRILDENPDLKSALYDDNGHIFNIACIREVPKQWGGLVYRRDILETMTDGNVTFPCGKDEPSTIEDWEYMLDLMKQYFDASGMPETACLILPSEGYFGTGELLAGFGIGGQDYVEDGKVKYGIAEDNFYNYLVKMREWYAKGYIYTDFASRAQDPFYLPNTALTYGGAAGIWFGFSSNLGTAMSIEEYGIHMDVSPMGAPADTEHGITTPIGVYLDSGRASNNAGFMITTSCNEEKLIRILTAFDYFFSEEGARVRTTGLTSEEGAAESAFYQSYGITNGTRLPNSMTWTDEMNHCSEQVDTFGANRMPGLEVNFPPREADLVDGVYLVDVGHYTWTQYGNACVFPLTASFTPEENERTNTINTNVQDYANSRIANFIMGREELNESTFADYQRQLDALGLQEYLAIRQAGYDRYIERAK